MTALFSYWRGMFPQPKNAQRSYWGGHFPEPKGASGAVPGVGSAGVATFALDMCEGTRVRWSWRSGLIKVRSGVENQRWPLWDLPRSAYSGVAYLIGDDARATRTTLMRFASSGRQFRIGLPWEAATLRADAAGAVVYVKDTSVLDWTVLGQRCIVQELGVAGLALSTIIQDVGADSITLDISPGSIGRKGGIIMPSVGAFLSPTQRFKRYTNPDGVEEWDIEAVQAAPFGFQQNGASASAVLAGSTGGVFHGATAIAVVSGAAGNGMSISLVPGSPTDAGIITTSGRNITYHYKTGVTTLAQALSVLAPYFRFIGSLGGPTLNDPIDSFGPVALAGGVDRINGFMGRGATLTTLDDGRAVWDRGVQLGSSDNASDGMQSMTELVDIGASLDEVGPATTPDWARQVSFERNDDEEFQWLKLFLATAQGRRKTWWLPTQRNDLTPISMSPGSLTVYGPSTGKGGFFYWYPRLRTRLQVRLADDSLAFLLVTSAIDHGDGTLTLTFTTSFPNYNTGGSGAALSAADIALVSWLELCRFEGDDFDVAFDKDVRAMTTQARVVQQ